MPVYGPWLEEVVLQLGIPQEVRRVERSWIASLDADLIVNCLGAGASRVYEDIGPGYFYRGILLICPFPTGSERVISYNYTPSYEAYPGFGGEAADVYFYPRYGHCVLGGTRQPGMVDGATGQFIAREPFPGDLVEIQGVEFPRPILDLNRELISKLTGIEIKGQFKPLVGFRHVDGTADSPKMTIELKERSGIPLHVDCLVLGVRESLYPGAPPSGC